MSSAEDQLSGSTGYLLSMLGAESRRRFSQALDAVDLRPAHYGAIMTLMTTGPASQQELARSVGIDPRNFVATIDRLEERGLVQRQPSKTDRRRHQVHLTPAGETLLEQLKTLGAEAEREFLTVLSPAEQTALREVLRKLYRHVTASD